MADDIVTRLRQEHVADWRHDAGECATCDAADEIERLREELESFGSTRQALRDKIRLRTQQRDEARAEVDVKGYRLDDALDEIERLRAAGERLWIHLDAHYGTGSPCPDDIQRVLDAWKEARRG